MAVAIDAGLLVALASDEPALDAVERELERAVRAGEALHAPMLIRYEVASALRRAIWDGRMAPAQAPAALAVAQAIPVRLQPPRDLVRAVEIAALLGRRRVNDTVYLALAERLRGPLLTLDGNLARRAGPHGFDVRLPAAAAT